MMENIESGDVVSFGLLCQTWGREENEWFEIFVGNFKRKDKIVLSVCLTEETELDRETLEKKIRPILADIPSPVRIEIQEKEALEKGQCDYWLKNDSLEKYKGNFKVDQSVVQNRSLAEVIELYFSRHPSKNAYEYSSLVDSYDFEKSGKGIKETEKGRIPETFGSSGGTNFGQMLKVLEESCREGSKILEVGCGAGAFYKTLEMNGRRYIYSGTDKSRRQIARCRENYPDIDFRVDDVCNMRTENGIYDFVFENNVLILTMDPIKGMAEMCRVSKGHVLFSIDLVNTAQGRYCYYPFSSKAKFDRRSQSICASKEEKAFFSGNRYRYKMLGPDEVLVMNVKVPVYVPCIDEFFMELSELVQSENLTILWQKQHGLKKEVWNNSQKTPEKILDDDFIVSDDDELIVLDAVKVTYFLKKNPQ